MMARTLIKETEGVGQIVIVGAGGFGREIAFLIEEINRHELAWNLLGFLDEDERKHNSVFSGSGVLGGLDWCARNKGLAVACGIGDTAGRKRVVRKLQTYDVAYPSLVHPNVVCYPSNVLGKGAIVSPGCILNVDVSVGEFVCFEMACSIGHDVVIHDFVSLMPGVRVSGNVVVEEGCYLGTGCTIIQGIRVGAWATVGAGAVVTEDVPDKCTVVGVPARVVRRGSAH